MPELCPKAKAKILLNQFFSYSPMVDLSNIKVLSNYLLSYHTKKVIIHKICANILKSYSKKAVVEDNNLNFFLNLFIYFSLLYLYRIFNKYQDTRSCSIHF